MTKGDLTTQWPKVPSLAKSSWGGCRCNLRGHRPRHQKEQTLSGTRIRDIHGALAQSTQGTKSSDRGCYQH